MHHILLTFYLIKTFKVLHNNNDLVHLQPHSPLFVDK